MADQTTSSDEPAGDLRLRAGLFHDADCDCDHCRYDRDVLARLRAPAFQYKIVEDWSDD